MKPTILLLFYILGMAISYGQNKEEILSFIDNKNSVINELIDDGGLRQYHTCYTNETSLEKGTLVFYYNSSELKHILHQYTIGRVTYKDVYYIWNDELFFQFSTHTVKYQEHLANTSNTSLVSEVALTLEDRYYFHNGEPIKCEFSSIETRSNRNKPSIKHNIIEAVDCKMVEKITKKYTSLLQYQNKKVKDPCDLSRSISSIMPEHIFNGSLGSN